MGREGGHLLQVQFWYHGGEKVLDILVMPGFGDPTSVCREVSLS